MTVTKLTLVPYEAAILRRKAKKVREPRSKEMQQIAKNMLHSIELNVLNKEAVGMAANQWGIDAQIFIFAPYGNGPGEQLQIIFNPTYKAINEELTSTEWEGCFSIPLALSQVKRFEKIKVTYQNLQGEYKIGELNGWEARVWQHETDHLNGILAEMGEKCYEKISFASEQEYQQFKER